jgi:hypothetical protein
MRVVLNECDTDWEEVLSGVPQGSVLGPLLFLLYVNDIPDVVESSVRLFADDTKMWKVIRNTDDRDKLQQDLGSLDQWSERWLLRFNTAKCKLMRIGKDSEIKYTLNDNGVQKELIKSGLEKDLGVWISSDLKWKEQCCKAANKGMSVLGMIRRTFKIVNEAAFKILYNTYVRPHLEYCVQAWCPHYRKDIDCLEKVQRRATKMVFGLEKFTYEERLERLKLFSLEQRRERGDLIEVYKNMQGKDKVQCSKLFQRAETDNLRGNSKKLYKAAARIDTRKYYFSMRVVDKWNKLPDTVVTADSIATFKDRLDRWMMGNRH